MNQGSQKKQESGETIDIKKFIFKTIANWYWFALSVLITLSISFIINRYTDPIYNLSAEVMVQDKDNTLSGGVEGILEEQGILRRTRKKVVENEIAILKSYTLTNKALQQLPDFFISYFSVGRVRTVERYKSCPFEVVIDSLEKNISPTPLHVKILSGSEYLLEVDDNVKLKEKVKFGEWFKFHNFSFKIILHKKYTKNDADLGLPYFFIVNNLNQLTNQYRTKINLNTTDKKSTIIDVSLQGHVPQKEADYINKLLEVYINSGLEEKNIIALNTIKFIDDQLHDITDSLQMNEKNLEQFRKSNKLIDISMEGSSLKQKIEDVQTQKADFYLKSRYYNYLKNYLSDRKDVSQLIAPSTMGINDLLLDKLLTELSDLYKERNTYNYLSNSKNPALDMVNYKIENIRNSLIENLNNLIGSNQLNIDGIEKQIGEVEKDIEKLPNTEKEFINLQRKYKLNDQIYTYLLTKRAESGIAKASNVPDNKIIDHALAQNASLVSPKKVFNYIVSIIIGFLIPMILIVLADFFNDKIVDRNDIDMNSNIPIIASIGHNNKTIDFVVFQKPKSSIAESFRTLRTNLQYLHVDKALKNHTIAITSTVSGEGKSFCALNLASIFALAGKKTVIVGLDLRKPKIHKDFGYENTVGVSTYLINNHTLDEVILPTVQENLFLVTSGPVPPNPAELLESKRMEQLISELKDRFEIIIIDTPPVALVTDSLLISKFTDTNIFVVRQNYSNRNVLRFVNNLYNDNNYKSLAILINDVKVPNYYGNKYGYGYGYRYGGYGYGYGYGNGYGYYDEEEDNTNKNFVSKTISSFPFSILSRKKQS